MIKPEAEDTPLNKYVLADVRKDEVPHEVSNTLELQIYSEILDYLSGNLAHLSNEVIKHIKNILNKRMYQDLFKPPQDVVLYRGMSLSQDEITKLLNIEQAKTDKPYFFKGSYVYSPRKNISSWTYDKETARYFSRVNKFHLKSIGVILHARPAQNKDSFLDLKPFYDKNKTIDEFRKEKEVFSLDKVNVFGVEIVKHNKIFKAEIID